MSPACSVRPLRRYPGTPYAEHHRKKFLRQQEVVETHAISDERPPHETYIQIAGAGQSLPAAKLSEAIDESVALHSVLLRYVHSFMMQTTQTALAKGRSIEERQASWLLMADDRVDGGELRVTHNSSGPSVTIALQELERRVSSGTSGAGSRSRTMLRCK